MSDVSRPLCVAEILTAHGVRGLVKLRCHLEDAGTLEGYNPLQDELGKAYTVTLKNRLKSDWVAEVTGIADRDAAEKLRGLRLYIDRAALPDPGSDAVYYDDLIGCKTLNPQGLVIGSVVAVENFGAGDLLEIRPQDSATTYYLPLSEPFVQRIDAASRTIVIEPAEEFMNE